MRYLFKNNKSHTVKLPGKDGKLVHFAIKEQKALDEYFKKYVPKYLSVLRIVNDNKKIDVKKTSADRSIKIVRPKNTEEKKKNNYISKRLVKNVGSDKGRKKVLVGRPSKSNRIDATKFSKSRIAENSIAISNDIGVGILSFNRLNSLIHLIESIRKHTDLNKTIVFVSDESTDKSVWEWLKQQNDIVAFHNERKGIAVNSNRLLRCLSRFKYKLILNDDVEVLRSGWDSFYFEYMKDHNIKHFCYRQNGIYGADRPKPVNGLIKVTDKPHGAVLAVHDDAFRKVGYFDEEFGTYGFEHVDFSDRIARACHGDSYYYDLNGSDKFFKIYNDSSSDPNKHENYSKSKSRYNKVSSDKSRIYINTSNDSVVPGVAYVIPFRDIGRQDCVKTVVNNIKAQRYPEVQIILSEQDSSSKINISDFSCIDHILVNNLYDNMHFSKSMAFNKGVELSRFNNVILHDADMLVRSDYSVKITKLLEEYESAHIGSTVCYMDKKSTDSIVKSQSIDRDNISSDRVVGYYEGGSFGITKNSYVRIGGFCEDFIGYGCFTEGNYVVTSDGLVDIKDVKEDDFVLTHTGNYNRVITKYSRHCCDSVFDVFIPGRLPIRGVTSEHPFMVDDKWIKAKDLEIGMKVGYQPSCLDLVQYADLSRLVEYDKSENSINVDYYSRYFSWFVGIFLAEGYVKLNKAVYLYIGEYENYLLSKIIRCINVINSNISVKSHYVKNGYREITIFSSKLAKIMNAISPKSTARNKVIAKWYLDNLSNDSKIKLIEGLIDGDGDKQRGSKKRFVYTTGSINLANIVSMILNQCGISHSFDIKRTGGFTENDYYSLTIDRKHEGLFDVVGIINDSAVIKNDSFNKIYDIKHRQISEPVYNLEVENDNSYVINGTVVHNCEDTEFYYRMTKGTRSYTQRSIDLFHLWHGRTDGWIERHDINKNIQSKMFKENLNKLCTRLRRFLISKYNKL